VFGAMCVLQLLVMALFLFIVVSSVKVASGQWSVLPTWPMFLFLAAIGASVAWLLFRSITAVKKEVKVFTDRP
jgi:TRAP-type C4-dicarboxylate transport system permease small subunit